jgi:hypothetical protein
MREHGDVVRLLLVPLNSGGITPPPAAPLPPGWRPVQARRRRGR